MPKKFSLGVVWYKSHGLIGEIAFGYGGNPKDFNLLSSDISKFDSNSFAKGMSTEFYSCNTGTGGEDSFAQLWAYLSKGRVKAAVGKTDYSDDFNFLEKIYRRLFNPRRKLNYDPNGNKTPILDKGARWELFYPRISQCID